MSGRRTGMVAAVVGGLAFLGGVVAGGLGPRAELRTLRAELLEAERTAAQAGRRSATSELTDLLVGGVRSSADPERPHRGSEERGAPAPQAEPEELAEDGLPVGEARDEVQPAEEGASRFELMADALELRRAQARAALVEDARPTPEQLDQIEQALVEMNEELEGFARELVALSAEGREPGRRDAMRLGLDALDLLVVTEDRMLEALDPDQRANLREASTDPTSFVDPAVLQIMSGLERSGGAAPR